MNYSLFSDEQFNQTYAGRYSPPYWQYTVIPRNYGEPIYAATIDFADPPFDYLGSYYPVNIDDILELFILDKRVLVTGVQIRIVETADIRLQLCTRSGIPFDAVDCAVAAQTVFMPFGGILSGATNIQNHSFVVEEPDYLGLKILDNPEELNNLKIDVLVSVSDSFVVDALTNSTKDT